MIIVGAMKTREESEDPEQGAGEQERLTDETQL